MLVTLTIPEFGLAVQTAWHRIIASAMGKLKHDTTYQRNLIKRMEEETIGACGEIAVGKFLGAFFVPGVGDYHRRPDCARDIEIRATHRQDGSLIVRDNDHPDRRYVLALVDGLTVRLAGWLHGKEARRLEWHTNPNAYRPAWFVPQSALKPMNTFQIGDK
jgi:hypothetical protein